MSFGFSVGDFVAVGNLCWTVYKRCKDSSGNYKELSNEVGALHNVIKETEELLSQQQLSPEQKSKLDLSRSGCEGILQDLDKLLAKYEGLGTKSQRTFDRMGFGMQNMNSIRTRLISNVTLLDTFNNVHSHARLEGKLNLLITEIRAGKREGSVVSTQTIDSFARRDQETWDELRRELEDVGISPLVITEKRQFIITWFQEAVAAGKLEVDPAEENFFSDRNSLMPDYDDTENATRGSGDELMSSGNDYTSLRRHSSSTSAVQSKQRDTNSPRPSYNLDLESVFGPPGRNQNENEKSRLRVSYLQLRHGYFGWMHWAEPRNPWAERAATLSAKLDRDAKQTLNILGGNTAPALSS